MLMFLLRYTCIQGIKESKRPFVSNFVGRTLEIKLGAIDMCWDIKGRGVVKVIFS